MERRIQDCHEAIIGNLEILCLRKILRVCWSKLIQVKSSLTSVDSPFSLSPSPTYSLIRTRRQRREIGQKNLVTMSHMPNVLEMCPLPSPSPLYPPGPPRPLLYPPGRGASIPFL